MTDSPDGHVPGHEGRHTGVSAFVMVRDEEKSLAACLDALTWTDDVVVLDSFSVDRTCEIAAEYPNVRLYRRHFIDFGDQRSYGLNQVSYPNPWVLIVDADEIVSESLGEEVLRAVSDEGAACRDIYLVRRTPWLEGRPLRHNLTASFWIPRLVRPECVKVNGRVHERITGSGSYGYLKSSLDHHQFAKGIENWRARRVRYARLESAALQSGEIAVFSLRNLFSRDRLQRRAAVKRAFQSFPSRYVLYILVNLLVYSAWRDGLTGLRYVALEARSQRDADRLLRGRRAC